MGAAECHRASNCCTDVDGKSLDNSPEKSSEQGTIKGLRPQKSHDASSEKQPVTIGTMYADIWRSNSLEERQARKKFYSPEEQSSMGNANGVFTRDEKDPYQVEWMEGPEHCFVVLPPGDCAPDGSGMLSCSDVGRFEGGLDESMCEGEETCNRPDRHANTSSNFHMGKPAAETASSQQRTRQAPKRNAVGIGTLLEAQRPSVKTAEEREFYSKASLKNHALRCFVSQNDEFIDLCQSLCAVSWTRKLAPGDKIVNQGDPAEYFFVVLQGRLECSVRNSLGNVEDVIMYFPGDSFGEESLVVPGPSSFSVEAGSDGATAHVVDRINFQQVLFSIRQDASQQYRRMLAEWTFLERLSEDELSELAKAMSEAEFKRGDIIIAQNDREGSLHLLVKGQVSVSQDQICKGMLTGSGSTPVPIGSQFLDSSNWKSDTTFTVASDVAFTVCIDKLSFDLLLGSLSSLSDQQRKKLRSRLNKMDEEIALNVPSAHTERKSLTTLGKLGSGSLGIVDIVEKTGGETFALKSLKKCSVSRSDLTKSVLSERRVLLMCESPFIVKLYDCYNELDRLSFLLELALGGELQELYWHYGLHGSLQHARFYVGGSTLALEHLHERGIACRDLKPENIVLMADGSMKLTDMGLAKIIRGKTGTCCGTLEYLAPEVVLLNGHTVAVDWWALGILLFDLMTGKTPFESSVPLKTAKNITIGIANVKLPDDVTSSGAALITQLCASRPMDRLPMTRLRVNGIMRHAWFQEFDWTGLECGTLQPPFKPRVESRRDFSNFAKSKDESTSTHDHAATNTAWEAIWEKQFATSV